MKLVVLVLALVIGLAVLVVLGHLAFIEIGKEVVTLRTPRPGGGFEETRLWVVDHDGAVWLHSAGDDWLARFEGDPIVELRRDGEIRSYTARLAPADHPEIDRLLRAKYGLADRWVRFLAPCDDSVVPVRLDPTATPSGQA